MGLGAILADVFARQAAAPLAPSFIGQIQQVDARLKAQGYDLVKMPTLSDDDFRRYSKMEGESQFIVQIDIVPEGPSSGMMSFIREDQPESFRHIHMREFLEQERQNSGFIGLVKRLAAGSKGV